MVNSLLIAEKLQAPYILAFIQPNLTTVAKGGANENLNVLIRKYFPKKYNFDLITKLQTQQIINILINRSRKKFGYKTPDEIFDKQSNSLLCDVAFIT